MLGYHIIYLFLFQTHAVNEVRRCIHVSVQYQIYYSTWLLHILYVYGACTRNMQPLNIIDLLFTLLIIMIMIMTWLPNPTYVFSLYRTSKVIDIPCPAKPISNWFTIDCLVVHVQEDHIVQTSGLEPASKDHWRFAPISYHHAPVCLGWYMNSSTTSLVVYVQCTWWESLHVSSRMFLGSGVACLWG